MPNWPRRMERRMWMNDICFRKCELLFGITQLLLLYFAASFLHVLTPFALNDILIYKYLMTTKKRWHRLLLYLNLFLSQQPLRSRNLPPRTSIQLHPTLTSTHFRNLHHRRPLGLGRLHGIPHHHWHQHINVLHWSILSLHGICRM